MSKLSKQEETSTIQMMKLYQNNVKQDISETSNVIKMVEEKLKVCTQSFISLKQVAQELNMDYKNLSNQVTVLGSSFKDMRTPLTSESSSMSRTSSLSSFVDDGLSVDGSSESSLPSQHSDLDEESDEYDELDSTYIFVKANPDGTATDEEIDEIRKWKLKKRSSIGTASLSSDQSDSARFSDEDENLSDVEKNEKLIQMLLKNSNIA